MDAPLNFKPGSNYRYSNSNFYLLCYIIEIVTGQAYEKYLQENVLDKAGLQNTFYIHHEKKHSGYAAGLFQIQWKNKKSNITDN